MSQIFHTPETFPVNGQLVYLRHGEAGTNICSNGLGEPAIFRLGTERELSSFTVGLIREGDTFIAGPGTIQIKAENHYWTPRAV